MGLGSFALSEQAIVQAERATIAKRPPAERVLKPTPDPVPTTAVR
jgi:hypothetical protein